MLITLFSPVMLVIPLIHIYPVAKAQKFTKTLWNKERIRNKESEYDHNHIHWLNDQHNPYKLINSESVSTIQKKTGVTPLHPLQKML